MNTNINRIIPGIKQFLFSYIPEDLKPPLQIKISLIAYYVIFLVAVLFLPITSYREFQAGLVFLAVLEALFLFFVILGMIGFWITRRLNVIRVCYSLGIFLLLFGLTLTMGGARGIGFFYIIAGYSALYYVFGFRFGVTIPLLVLLGNLIRIHFGNWNEFSIFNQPEIVLSYFLTVTAAAFLGVSSIIFQHLVITYLSKIAYSDELTQLSTRQHFEVLLDQKVQPRKGKRNPTTLIAIKLLHFARINSLYGAEIADEVLRSIGDRLITHKHWYHLGARYTGTIFFFMISEVDMLEIEQRAHQLYDLCTKDLEIHGQRIPIQALVSVTRYPQDSLSASSLIGNLMSGIAKIRSRPGTIHFYDQSQFEEELHRFSLIEHMRHGIEAGEFSLVYQPKVDLVHGNCCGAEVLLRWNNPLFGYVEPSFFIPLAEESGLVRSITRWVLNQVVQDLTRYNQSIKSLGCGSKTCTISVNISPHDLADPDFEGFIRRIIRQLDRFSQQLELEITEGVLLDRNPIVKRNLDAVLEMGGRISIDDFGTGYSSLSYLQHLHAHTLKIDRVFVATLSNLTPKAPIVDAIISMAKSLELEIVAEGIETEFQRTYLQQRGCDLAQGWLFAKPLGFDQFLEFVVQNQKHRNS
jgi:diguanylate cyclase (GGDEF)-like protein